MKNKEDIRKLEEGAIVKYESPSSRVKYRPISTQIICQKCGSSKNLTKTIVDGKEFWFCRDCIMQRAKELKNRK